MSHSCMRAAGRRPGALILAARRTGRPFVTTYHGAYGTFGPFKTAYNSVMGRGDRVIANSRYTANLIAERHRLKQEHIRTIYRGIDEAAFDPLVVPPGPVDEAPRTLGGFAGNQDRAASGAAHGLEGPPPDHRGGGGSCPRRRPR